MELSKVLRKKKKLESSDFGVPCCVRQLLKLERLTCYYRYHHKYMTCHQRTSCTNIEKGHR